MTKDGFSISNSLFVHLLMLNWHRYFADICKKFQHICEISANIYSRNAPDMNKTITNIVHYCNRYVTDSCRYFPYLSIWKGIASFLVRLM